jgi:hypothetical protein
LIFIGTNLLSTLFHEHAFGHIEVKVNKVNIGELYIEADGFYVFQPAEYKTGYWPEWVLRSIADKLRELNAEWQAEIEKIGPPLDSGSSSEVY